MPRPGTTTAYGATETLTVHALAPTGLTARYRIASGQASRTLTPGAVLSNIPADEAAALLDMRVRCTDGVVRCPVS